VSSVEQMFEDDFAHSRQVTAGDYRDKPWWFKFAVKPARLTAPE